MLLVGAGLLLKSFITVRTRPLGFNPAGVIAATVTLPETDYATGAETKAFFRQALAAPDEAAWLSERQASLIY